MRRKLFFCIFLYVLLVVLFTSTFDNLTVETILNDKPKKYTGTIKSIDIEVENTSLVVELSKGEKVLLKCYEEQGISQQDYASTIKFTGILEHPGGQRNPKCFDYGLYLKSIGIEYIVYTEDIKIIGKTSSIYDKCCSFLLSKKEEFLETIEDMATRNFVDGILFGNTANISEEIYDDFKANGTAHILAVSGLHIGIIHSILERIIGKKQSIINFLVTVCFIWAICVLAGFTPSVIRAGGMILLKKYALYKDYRYDSLTALALIALLMIVNNPYIVYNASFQMSFLAAISIIFIIPHISRKIPDFLAIIIAVNIGLIPYQVYQFNTFSITSFLANIPVVFVTGILLPIAFGQFIFFLLTGINITFIIGAMSNFLIEINKICTLEIELIDVISPPIWVMFLLYLVMAFIFSETFYILLIRKKNKLISLIFLIICFISVSSSAIFFNEFDDADIVFVDVGQGDCVHIKESGINVLIDGGGSPDYEIGRKTLKPYLLKNGVEKIDLAIATHKHTDHYKGLEELKEEGIIDTIEVGITAGKTYKIAEDIYVETLWPKEKVTDDIEQDENKNCSVFMIHYKNKKILVTGDLDEEGERAMLEYYKGSNTLKADILKVGHHGSRYSTSIEFLKEVNPSYGVIQVGKNNYGHPHTKTIEKFNKNCIMLLRNDIHGAIGFSLDEETIKYCTMS